MKFWKGLREPPLFSLWILLLEQEEPRYGRVDHWSGCFCVLNEIPMSSFEGRQHVRIAIFKESLELMAWRCPLWHVEGHTNYPQRGKNILKVAHT